MSSGTEVSGPGVTGDGDVRPGGGPDREPVAAVPEGPGAPVRGRTGAPSPTRCSPGSDRTSRTRVSCPRPRPCRSVDTGRGSVQFVRADGRGELASGQTAGDLDHPHIVHHRPPVRTELLPPRRPTCRPALRLLSRVLTRVRVETGHWGAPVSFLGLRRVRLYDARSSCLTYLAHNGVPDHILARWAGHTNVKTTKKWYVKPDVKDLREAATTSDGLHGVATEGQA
jgi:hypothetical protein